MAGFCHTWIPNFGLMAKSLYEALKGNDSESLSWTEESSKAFPTIQIIEVCSNRADLTDQIRKFRCGNGYRRSSFMDGAVQS